MRPDETEDIDLLDVDRAYEHARDPSNRVGLLYAQARRAWRDLLTAERLAGFFSGFLMALVFVGFIYLADVIVRAP